MMFVYLTIGSLIGVIILLSGFIVVMQAKHNQMLSDMSVKEFEKYQAWNAERQQLLDRIQAPSFAEYKHQEVKVIKAQNNVPEPPKLEVM